MRIVLFLTFTLFIVTALAAQSVNPPDREDLLAGTSAGQTSFAERAGYPTPDRLLAWKDQLGLTRHQLRKIDAIVKDQPVSLKVKGEEIVEAEDDLLKTFEAGTANERNIRLKLERIGKLRGELRFGQLQVFIRMKALLTTKQFDRYKELAAAAAK